VSEPSRSAGSASGVERDPAERSPRDYMLVEAAAIADAATRMDEAAFERAVTLLTQCTGKIILTGVGTSGIIARKIAATMTSTGSPSIFLHPADAVHGALGIVAPGDVVVAISNSGETDEIMSITPYIHARNVAIIAIVGNVHSTIGRAAVVALDARATREACPLDLAPTASTAVALAVGDALALTISTRRALTPEAFARNHPSGRLGRRLTLRVADVLGDAPPRPVVRPDAGWLEIVTAIGSGGVGAVLVVDESEQLRGIVTDGDFRRAALKVGVEGLVAVKAADLMTPEPVVVACDSLAFDALRLMENRPSQISVLPVVDGQGGCVGLVRVHDLVRAGVL
jgi:arabinose-5-phosphate isomerase